MAPAGSRGRSEHPVAALQRQLIAPAIAPADGDRVGTVAGGGHRDQRPMTGGAGSAALPMSARAATGAKMYEY